MGLITIKPPFGEVPFRRVFVIFFLRPAAIFCDPNFLPLPWAESHGETQLELNGHSLKKVVNKNRWWRWFVPKKMPKKNVFFMSCFSKIGFRFFLMFLPKKVQRMIDCVKSWAKMFHVAFCYKENHPKPHLECVLHGSSIFHDRFFFPLHFFVQMLQSASVVSRFLFSKFHGGSVSPKEI